MGNLDSSHPGAEAAVAQTTAWEVEGALALLHWHREADISMIIFMIVPNCRVAEDGVCGGRVYGVRFMPRCACCRPPASIATCTVSARAPTFQVLLVGRLKFPDLSGPEHINLDVPEVHQRSGNVPGPSRCRSAQCESREQLAVQFPQLRSQQRVNVL